MEDPCEARQKIWCAAILRDNWTQYDVDNAVDYLQNLLFFKLVEVSHLMGKILKYYLVFRNRGMYKNKGKMDWIKLS